MVASDRTKGCCSSDLNEPPHPNHDQFAELDAHNSPSSIDDLSEIACARSTDDRFLYTGLIRLHVMQHAVKEPVYGLALIEELGRHDYKVSAGTLYPILYGLEEKGYLTSKEERTGRATRRICRATPTGIRALSAAKLKVRELFGELFEDEEVRLPLI